MHKKDVDTVAKTVTLLLTSASFVLVLVGLTDLGHIKTFRFVLGEVAMVTAIAYSFQMARGDKFVSLSATMWFIVASISFAQAAWFAR